MPEELYKFLVSWIRYKMVLVDTAFCKLAVDEFLSILHIISINCNYVQSGRGD